MGFQTIGTPQALGDEGDVPGADPLASDFTSFNVDPDDDEFASAIYSGVQWSVLDVRVTPSEALLAQATIQVDVEVANTLETSTLGISDRMVSLVVDDGTVIDGARFVNTGPRVRLVAGEAQTMTVEFRTGHAKDPDPETLTLQIAESNRQPAEIPLAGQSSEAPELVFAGVDNTPQAIPDPDDASRWIIVEPRSATVGLDVGPYRAGDGERLALVKVTVQRAASADDAGFIDPGFWSLIADDEASAPVLVVRSGQPATNTDELVLLFAFPEDADELALEAGTGTDEPVQAAVVLPAVS
ncbi:MAG: hypothetical protein AAF467_16345 [Actinomycetota bacterium]